MKSPRTNRSATVYLVLAVFAFAVYATGSWWGTPHANGPDRTHSWGVDDEIPLGPLAEMHNIISPKADRNLGYPLMYAFVLTGAYTPYLAYLKLTGKWSKVSGVYPFGMQDPVQSLRVMTYIAHFVAVLMGMGIVLAAYETGRVLMSRGAGVFAALFAMSSYPMFYYTRTGNVDVPMLFFVALTVMCFARILAFGFTPRRAIWLGLFAGFAMATKEQAVGVILAMPFLLLPLCAQDHAGRWRTWPFWRTPAIGLFTAILAFGFGSGLFVEPSRFFAHLELTLSHIDRIAQGKLYVPYVFPFTMDANLGYGLRVSELLTTLVTLPGALLALAGFVVLLFRDDKVRSISIIVIVYVIVAFFTLRSPQLRYFMPVGYLLAFPAAWAVTAAWAHRSALLRWGVALAGVGIVGFNLLRGAALTYEMIHDSRYEAAAWLARNTADGDVIEYFGVRHKLPPVAPGVVLRRATYYGGVYRPVRTDDEKIREILQGWQERRPKYVVIVPDLTSQPGSAYSGYCPPRLCDALLDGSADFPLAARFRTKPLFSWLELPALDYPSVNPPIHIFSMRKASGS